MNDQNRFEEYISQHPRVSLQLAVIGLSLLWLSVVGVLGLVCYVIFSKILKAQWWLLMVFGAAIASSVVALYWYHGLFYVNLGSFIRSGFLLNVAFWKRMGSCGVGCAVSYLCQHAQLYLLGFPVLLGGVLSAIDLIKDNPHKNVMDDLQKGKLVNIQPELNDSKIDKAMKKLSKIEVDATVLGVSKYTGEAVFLPDRYVNQMVLVLGTTGSGKTITLRRFHQRAISKGYPLIVVDGKPTDENVEWLVNLAQKYNRPFYGFNCGNYLHYDPLANGGYTELKDKIISLKDQWENDYYRSIAEDYLQTTFEVLLKSGVSLDLQLVTNCLNYDELVEMSLMLNDKVLHNRVVGLAKYDRKDITGLQAHLNLLIHSELGQYFEINKDTFTLNQAVQSDAVVYFSLPALRFPSFSKVLGKLVINDLKSVIDRNSTHHKPLFMMFDEFSVFAGEQVLNLVNMGRGKGVHAVFGTQGLADLEKVDVTLKSQILNCVNTLICHRLNDHASAESVANWIGTQDAFSVTSQLNVQQGDAKMGSVKQGKEYIVHTDAIKQGLRTGEAFYVTKVGRFRRDKVCVKLL